MTLAQQSAYQRVYVEPEVEMHGAQWGEQRVESVFLMIYE